MRHSLFVWDILTRSKALMPAKKQAVIVRRKFSSNQRQADNFEHVIWQFVEGRPRPFFVEGTGGMLGEDQKLTQTLISCESRKPSFTRLVAQTLL